VPKVLDDSNSPPLLGIGAFRDSAFSTQSEMSCEIPIKWTGPFKEELNTNSEKSKLNPNCLSNGPRFPGGWQPTPIEEKGEDELRQQQRPSEERKSTTTPIQEIGSRVESPEIVKPDMSLRKSEAALVRIIQDTSPRPSLTNFGNSQWKQNSAPVAGQGWVLVNVENSNNPSPTVDPQGPPGDIKDVRSPEPIQPDPLFGPDSSIKFPIGETSAAAKAIVIIDSMDSKHKKSRSTSNHKDGREGSSGVRRFFSLNRKNSVEEGA
jgi:hypothetical protein